MSSKGPSFPQGKKDQTLSSSIAAGEIPVSPRTVSPQGESGSGNQEELEKIATEIKHCQNCPLFKTATNPVPGAANPNAEIVFVGEAPGYWEDQKGIPFVGAAGHLLDQMLAEIKLKREDVFVANILKHRPPNNREPQPNEITACTPFLKRQLLVIKPKIVVTLGRFAMNYFLPNEYISRVHGKTRSILWQGLSLTVVPLYHPAAALRGTTVMEELKQDFLKLPEIINQSQNKESSSQNEKVALPKIEQKTLF